MKKLIVSGLAAATIGGGVYFLSEEEQPPEPPSCSSTYQVNEYPTEPIRVVFESDCQTWCEEKSCQFLRANIGPIAGDNPNKFYSACVCQ